MAYPWGAALHYLSAVFVPVFSVGAGLAALAGLVVCVLMRAGRSSRPAGFSVPIPAQRVSHEGVTRR